MPDVSLGSVIKNGFEAYNTYYRVVYAKNIMQMFIEGASIQQVLATVAIDAAFNWAGGKACEAALGSMIKNAGSLLKKIKTARAYIERHHVFPKFLGGDPDGLLAGLSRKFHQAFHSDLLAALRERGMKRPGKGSCDEWAELLREGNNMQLMMDALIQTSKRWDDKLGGDVLTTALMQQLRNQGLL